MKINWGKVLSKAEEGLHIAAQFDPRIAVIDNAITSVQQAVPDNPGANKKETVVAVSDAVMESALVGASPEQIAQFKALRSTYIDLTVRQKQIVADAAASRVALMEFMQSIKAAPAAPAQ